MDELYEKILQRDIPFHGKYLDLEQWSIELPDGRKGRREIVRAPDAVAVFPVDVEENIHLVRQHRPAIGRTLLEIPAGLIDSGESEETAAVRECGEEIGFHPARLIRLLTYAHAEGYSTGWTTLFLGLDLTTADASSLDATELLKPTVMAFTELKELVKRGEIKDSKTILSVLLWSSLRKEGDGRLSRF